LRLRHRNFRLFYYGQMVSLTAPGCSPWPLAGWSWWLTDSAFYLGLVGALQTLPCFFFLSWRGGGDHTSKLKLLFITQAVLMLLALALGCW